MKIHWATDYEGIGNAYGYSVHNSRTREALASHGVTFDKDATVAFHVAPAHRFRPVSGKFNVLYTAHEMHDLSQKYVDGLANADVVLVTAGFLVDVVKKCLPDKPVHLCHLGVDVDTFAYRQRKFSVPFRFLWVGAPNARKGWEIVMHAWEAFRNAPECELYIKTTVTKQMTGRGNVVFDSRNLSVAELVRLYHSAHCFLFPSFGEGFGLTMAEAMATGLPVIYTPWTAMLDVNNAKCGYPLKYRVVTGRYYGVDTQLAQADTGDMVRKMLEVIRRYRRAARKGQGAARRIRKHFTWDHTARRILRILKNNVERTDLGETFMNKGSPPYPFPNTLPAMSHSLIASRKM